MSVCCTGTDAVAAGTVEISKEQSFPYYGAEGTDILSEFGLVASGFVIAKYNLEFGSAPNLELRRDILALNQTLNQGRP